MSDSAQMEIAQIEINLHYYNYLWTIRGICPFSFVSRSVYLATYFFALVVVVHYRACAYEKYMDRGWETSELSDEWKPNEELYSTGFGPFDVVCWPCWVDNKLCLEGPVTSISTSVTCWHPELHLSVKLFGMCRPKKSACVKVKLV